MIDPPAHPDAFAAHTLTLWGRDRTYSPHERAAWRRGFIAGLETVVFGVLGALLLIAGLRTL